MNMRVIALLFVISAISTQEIRKSLQDVCEDTPLTEFEIHLLPASSDYYAIGEGIVNAVEIQQGVFLAVCGSFQLELIHPDPNEQAYEKGTISSDAVAQSYILRSAQIFAGVPTDNLIYFGASDNYVSFSGLYFESADSNYILNLYYGMTRIGATPDYHIEIQKKQDTSSNTRSIIGTLVSLLVEKGVDPGTCPMSSFQQFKYKIRTFTESNGESESASESESESESGEDGYQYAVKGKMEIGGVATYSDNGKPTIFAAACGTLSIWEYHVDPHYSLGYASFDPTKTSFSIRNPPAWTNGYPSDNIVYTKQRLIDFYGLSFVSNDDARNIVCLYDQPATGASTYAGPGIEFEPFPTQPAGYTILLGLKGTAYLPGGNFSVTSISLYWEK